MATKLPYSFFARDTRDVARDLLGKFLVRETPSGRVEGMIVETEAYHGWHDRASHASRGLTKRNAPMFGPPGTIYVYLVYGMHHCLNISTVEKGFPAAVLIRATDTASGPGRLSRYFEIDLALSGRRLGKSSGLWIEDRGVRQERDKIQETKRVGVEYAGISKDWRWRYTIKS